MAAEQPDERPYFHLHRTGGGVGTMEPTDGTRLTRYPNAVAQATLSTAAASSSTRSSATVQTQPELDSPEATDSL